jgi:TPP-dependent indolepyruvate ferredoxin oxidoreductase alpha subunit
VGLASTIAFYNIHLLLHNPQEKTLTITVGGLQYTDNIELLKRHYLLEENHWKNHLPSPLNKPETFLFIERKEKSLLEEDEKSQFGEGEGSTLAEEEEETPLKESIISGFSSISSSEILKIPLQIHTQNQKFKIAKILIKTSQF